MAIRWTAIVAAALGGIALAGCSALTGMNPFSRPEEILPGDRRAVLPSASDEVSGGTVSVAGAAPLGDWSQPGGNAANNPGHVALAGNGGAQAWRARVIDSPGRRGARSTVPPLVHGGRIFVYDAGGRVSSIASGGGTQWSVSLAPEDEKSATPGGGIAASGDLVFAATGFGDLVALDASSGAKVWTFRLSAQARAAPTAAGDKVYVVTATNVLHAVNQSDGNEVWQYPGIPETAGVLSSASPAVSGGTVVVPYSSGEVIAFDAATGDLKWSDAVVRSSRTLAVSGLTDVAASPVVVDGIAYASGIAGRTIAVRLSDGERIWEQNIGSGSTPVVSGSALFLVDLEDNLVAMDRSSGEVIWRTALPVIRKKRFFSVWSGPTLAGGALWAVSNDGKIVGVDPGAGNIVSDRELSGPAYVKPIAANGQLLVLSGDGMLSAFQ